MTTEWFKPPSGSVLPRHEHHLIQREMPQLTNAQSTEREGKILLAIKAYNAGRFQSLRRAANTYDVPYTSLRHRYAGMPARRDSTPNCKRLSESEEQTVIRYILDLDSRGFSPTLGEVGDMANKLLAARGEEHVGPTWARRLVNRTNELKMRFTRAKDHQRAKQEDPVVISNWFQLIANTKAKYGIIDEDTYNFDETGFQMGVIGSMKVVTGSERRSRPDLFQPGNREWVTVIQGISASGYALPPFIIYKGKNHLSGWYEETGIPSNWVFGVSDNGWTNNALGFEWLKHFNAHTEERTVGVWRLLILDGHESHNSQDFKDYCEEHKIITLCMPAHSSHILQPLDVGCFSPLKKRYSQRVRDLARLHIFHIDKMGFLPAFCNAFYASFTKDNILGSFRGAGLVPFDPQSVIDRLDVRLATPPGPLLEPSVWQSKTPSNTVEFGSQSRLISTKFGSSPASIKDGYQSLIKGATQMIHESTLMKDRIAQLEQQVEELSKRKSRKRKRIQKGGILQFGEASQLDATESPTAQGGSKRTRGGGGADGTQPTQRRCRRCRETGHNARTCEKVEESASESDASTQYIYSDDSVE
jgi:hypothetical protein